MAVKIKKTWNGISVNQLNGLYYLIGRLPYSQVKAARESRKRNERLSVSENKEFKH